MNVRPSNAVAVAAVERSWGGINAESVHTVLWKSIVTGIVISAIFRNASTDPHYRGRRRPRRGRQGQRHRHRHEVLQIVMVGRSERRSITTFLGPADAVAVGRGPSNLSLECACGNSVVSCVVLSLLWILWVTSCLLWLKCVSIKVTQFRQALF